MNRLICFVSISTVWTVIIASSGLAFAKRVTIGFDDVADGAKVTKAYKEQGVILRCRGPWPECPLVDNTDAFVYEDYHALSGTNVMGGKFLAGAHWLSFPIGYGVATFIEPADYVCLYGVGGPFQVLVYDEENNELGPFFSNTVQAIAPHPTGCDVNFGEIHASELETDGGLITKIKFGSINANKMDDVTYFDDLTFNVNQTPIADAGPDQTVYEGSTVILDGRSSADPDGEAQIDSLLWEQTDGPTVTLSDPTTARPTFVAPPVDVDGTMVAFQLTVVDNGGLEDVAGVSIEVQDNGITGFGFPSDAITTYTSTGEPIAVQVDNSSHITSLYVLDPAALSGPEEEMPDNLIYGLIDMQIMVDRPGHRVTVTIHFPRPAPVDYKWYKFSSTVGWIDFDRKEVSDGRGDGAEFNSDRTQVVLHATDNGLYDDDTRDMILRDPSGLGFTASASLPSSPVELSLFGEGGGCFVSTATHGFPVVSLFVFFTIIVITALTFRVRRYKGLEVHMLEAACPTRGVWMSIQYDLTAWN
jgi:hypothetical protein